jgi:phage tail sheath protein FI
MTYKHGVYVTEVPTSILPPVRTNAGLPVVFGTAPIHMSADGLGKVNEPVLCYTYAEAAQALGFLDADATTGQFEFTLSEAVSAFFRVNAVAPIVLVNVLDPADHRTVVTNESRTFNADNEVTLSVAHPMPGTIVVTNTAGSTTYVKGTDYEVTINSLGRGIITRLSGGAIASSATVHVDYNALDASEVAASDIVGGIDVGTGAKTGLELVADIFPRFRLVPGQILAPKFSTDPAVALVMSAKAGNINGHFKAMALVDVPTGEVTVAADVPAWKNDNNYVEPNMIVCWPKGSLAGQQYHLSTLAAARCMRTDADNEGVPYESPSNKNIPINAAVLEDGTEIVLDTLAAAALNGEGIVTALNFIGGWVLWGNRTGAYPGSTDPKDTFIPIRRMFNWNTSSLVLSYWQKVDNPLNRRLIETVVDSENIRLNGLAARQFILGGRVEFREDENPTTDLIDGIVRFHQYFTPPAPAEQISWITEFDPEYVNTLFGGN